MIPASTSSRFFLRLPTEALPSQGVLCAGPDPFRRTLLDTPDTSLHRSHLRALRHGPPYRGEEEVVRTFRSRLSQNLVGCFYAGFFPPPGPRTSN